MSQTINSEFFILTYGAIVSHLLEELKTDEKVNKQLDIMGFNIGTRLVDEYLARSSSRGSCREFKDTAPAVVDAIQQFLGCEATFDLSTEDSNVYTISIDHNPLERWAVLPSSLHALHYSQLLCGCIRGALHMLSMEVLAVIERDSLQLGERGGRTVFKVTLDKILLDKFEG
eukprot:gnl/Dysnectes_brevis/2526_a3033_1694.p1 GENE.gnl/Dysnectes_brevis/2526_a3033_1694~~gnl/Dysnectes_brevis/2526_a3033_1694.p1  ORF type:complete len:172 (-),score=37.11 gnl/Dysnectes_brevis/2526_a3033_1694:42-557(-)